MCSVQKTGLAVYRTKKFRGANITTVLEIDKKIPKAEVILLQPSVLRIHIQYFLVLRHSVGGAAEFVIVIVNILA